MVKTRQIRHCQRFEKIGRHVGGMLNPHNIFLINCVSKNDSFVSQRNLAV